MFSLYQHESRLKKERRRRNGLDSFLNKHERILEVYGMNEERLIQKSRRRQVESQERTEVKEEEPDEQSPYFPKFRDETKEKHLSHPFLSTNLSTLPRAVFLGGGLKLPAETDRVEDAREKILSKQMGKKLSSIKKPPYKTEGPYHFRDRHDEKELFGDFTVPVRHSLTDLIARKVTLEEPTEKVWPFYKRHTKQPKKLLGGDDFKVPAIGDVMRPSTADLSMFREFYEERVDPAKLNRPRQKHLELSLHFRSMFPERLLTETELRPRTAPS